MCIRDSLLAEGKSIYYTAMGLFGVAFHGASPAILDTATIQFLQFGLLALGFIGSLYVAYRIAKNNRADGKGWGTFVPYAVLMLSLLPLRTSRTAFGTKVRVGWLASVPLAILNTAAACAWAAAARGAPWATVMENAPSAFLFIAVFGSIVWVPALLCTLACFGLPIAWAQSLAKKGLSGAERGEALSLIHISEPTRPY